MTISEKYYRIFYKVKDGEKLTNEQWKVVNMMHACLKENNKPKLPTGAIVVNKKHLVEHLETVSKAIKQVDTLYQNRALADNERGKKVAMVMNALQFSVHSIKHFELNIDIKKLDK